MEKIMNAMDPGTRRAIETGECGGPCTGWQKNYDDHIAGQLNAIEQWKNEIAAQEQKLEESK